MQYTLNPLDAKIVAQALGSKVACLVQAAAYIDDADKKFTGELKDDAEHIRDLMLYFATGSLPGS